jgi:hypothetical protein
MAIEVDRQQAAGVIGEQRIDAEHLATFEVSPQLAFLGR